MNPDANYQLISRKGMAFVGQNGGEASAAARKMPCEPFHSYTTGAVVVTKRAPPLLRLAEELGNVSEVCKSMDNHRRTFYGIRPPFRSAAWWH